MKVKKMKPILALVLATSLVGCTQNDTSNVNNNNKKVQEQVIEDDGAINENDQEIDQDGTTAQDTDKESEELKARIEEQYEKIENIQSEIEIDGVKSKVSLNEDEFVKNFELTKKEEDSEEEIEQMEKQYTTKNGGIVKITTVESPYFTLEEGSDDLAQDIEKQIASISFGDNTNVKLPADIDDSDDLETAKKKANSIIELDADFDPNVVTVVTNDLMFNLFYEDNKLSEIAFGDVDEYSIKQLLIMQDYKNNYEKDESASFKIGGTDLKLPIKIQELEQKLKGKSELATKENVKEFYPDDIDIDTIYIDDQKVIESKDGKFLVNYISEETFKDGWQSDEMIKDLIDEVSFIQFKTSTPFELSNDKVTINNENIENIREVLKDAEIDYEDNSSDEYTYIEFFLDDNHFIRIDNDMIRINRSDKSSRDMSRSSQRLFKDMEENSYVKEIFSGDPENQQIEEVEEIENDTNIEDEVEPQELEEVKEIDNN